MNFHATFDRLHAFLRQLEHLDNVDLVDAFINETIENGGHYCTPKSGGVQNHDFKITLYNIHASGADEEDALRNWIHAARAHVKIIEDDGLITVHLPFPNPRNHAEEIANARAAENQALIKDRIADPTQKGTRS